MYEAPVSCRPMTPPTGLRRALVIVCNLSVRFILFYFVLVSYLHVLEFVLSYPGDHGLYLTALSISMLRRDSVEVRLELAR